MEKEQQEAENRVQITKAVFDGLEAIRRSGTTNMLDLEVVLFLAREWGLADTVAWIESVDTGTYGRLILRGPEVIDGESLDEKLDRMDRDYDEERKEFWEGQPSPRDKARDEDPSDQDITSETMDNRQLLLQLGKQASLAIAASYETEQMGVLIDESRLAQIYAERIALNRSLAEASKLWLELGGTIGEIQRGIGSLQFMIDPENN